jgi:hypothetical protein
MSLNANCCDGSSKKFNPNCTLGPATRFGATSLVFLCSRQTDRVCFQSSERENEAKDRASQRHVDGSRAAETLELLEKYRPEYTWEHCNFVRLTFLAGNVFEVYRDLNPCNNGAGTGEGFNHTRTYD